MQFATALRDRFLSLLPSVFLPLVSLPIAEIVALADP